MPTRSPHSRASSAVSFSARRRVSRSPAVVLVEAGAQVDAELADVDQRARVDDRGGVAVARAHVSLHVRK
jgi:hypothetical protein